MNELINEADEVPMPKRAPPKAPNPEPVFMSMPGNMAPVGPHSHARGETTVRANTTIKRFKAPLPKEHLYTFEDESLFRVKGRCSFKLRDSSSFPCTAKGSVRVKFQ